MANLVAMRRQLMAFRTALIQMPVFSSGRPDSDEKADRQTAQLENIGLQLQLILRDLINSENLARVQHGNLRKVPLDQRWSATQSVEQRIREVAEAVAEAQNLADQVKDLLQRNGIITPIQAAKKTMDLIEDLEKHLPGHTQAVTSQPTNMPIYTSSETGPPQVESLVPLVTLICLGIRYLKQRYSSKAK
jgi:hypothetical protein